MPTSSSRSALSPETREFAEDPEAFLAPHDARVVDEQRFRATISADGKGIHVARLRFAPGEAEAVVREVHASSPGVTAAWETASAELAAALRAAGCRDPDPPIAPWCTALATEREPPSAGGVEVRTIETFEEHLVGLEIELAASRWTPEGAAQRRAEAAVSYERRRSRPGGQWLAYLDGHPVAWAGAVASERGLYLAGGATLAEARGRGCYRALVHARWQDAAARGTPALVVHAQETSRPILERLGFERVATIYELASGGRS